MCIHLSHWTLNLSTVIRQTKCFHMGLFAKIMVNGFHFLQQKPWQLFLAKKLEKYELRVRDRVHGLKHKRTQTSVQRPQQSFAFHAANLKKYFSFIWG